MKLKYLRNVASLNIDCCKCTGCGVCFDVCPHEVIEISEKKAVIKDLDSCMECGACLKNCPFDAISVSKGVGCAIAVLNSRKKNGECCCG
jgi:NAD-dependent dihydropyrimidine dehydrogenase PreA subunit